MHVVMILTLTAAFQLPMVPRPSVRVRSLDEQDAAGFTTKQRLREEIDSPFRKVRVVFFGFGTGSALIALYFSLINVIKGSNVAQDVGINVVALVTCAYLTYRDVKAGEANLQRIQKGGQLAALRVATTTGTTSLGAMRGEKRLLIAAGGEEYIANLRKASSVVADDLDRVNVALIPVLLDGETVDVVKLRELWGDADDCVCFPLLSEPWTAYLASEIATAKSQNFDPESKGICIYVKKNGRILRRATGMPDWATFISTMEVMDGSQFGRPKL